jgi:hypothetical protein
MIMNRMPTANPAMTGTASAKFGKMITFHLL